MKKKKFNFKALIFMSLCLTLLFSISSFALENTLYEDIDLGEYSQYFIIQSSMDNYYFVRGNNIAYDSVNDRMINCADLVLTSDGGLTWSTNFVDYSELNSFSVNYTLENSNFDILDSNDNSVYFAKTDFSVDNSVDNINESANLDITFDLEQVIDFAQILINAMLPVVYIMLGVGLAFIIINALKRVF